MTEKKIRSLQRTYRKYLFNLLDLWNKYNIWWHSPFKVAWRKVKEHWRSYWNDMNRYDGHRWWRGRRNCWRRRRNCRHSCRWRLRWRLRWRGRRCRWQRRSRFRWCWLHRGRPARRSPKRWWGRRSWQRRSQVGERRNLPSTFKSRNRERRSWRSTPKSHNSSVLLRRLPVLFAIGIMTSGGEEGASGVGAGGEHRWAPYSLKR